jgi:hypothetical protein
LQNVDGGLKVGHAVDVVLANQAQLGKSHVHARQLAKVRASRAGVDATRDLQLAPRKLEIVLFILCRVLALSRHLAALALDALGATRAAGGILKPAVRTMPPWDLGARQAMPCGMRYEQQLDK